MAIKWERVVFDAIAGSTTDRLRVPGGWLVRTFVYDGDDNQSLFAQTFVLDPTHEWSLENENRN